MKTNNMIRNIFYCVIILKLISCSYDNSFVKKEYYPNGNLESEVLIKDGKENGLKKYYFENGTLQALISKKDDKKNGYALYFNQNSKLTSVMYYHNDTSNDDHVSFNEDGKLNFYSKFEKGITKFHMFFDGNGNIYSSAPFLTITTKKDTLKLGETYTAAIKLNYLFPHYKCLIGLDSSKSDTQIFLQPLSRNTNATYTFSPETKGIYEYVISAVLTDTIRDKQKILSYTGKFWVR